MRGYLFVFLSALCWGGIGPVSKYAFSSGLEPLQVAFWRAIIGWIFFAIHASVIKSLKIQKNDTLSLLFFGITCVTIFYASYQFAIQLTGASFASVLLYTAPAWVVVLARIFLAEPLSFWKLLSVFLTMVGVAGVAFGSRGGLNVSWDLLGFGCGLVAGFTYSLYYVLGKKILSKYPAPTLFLYALPIGALGLLPFCDIELPNAQGWLALGILAFVSTYGAYIFYSLGLKYLEGSKAAIIATMEPVIAGVMAYFWWNEQFTLVGYIGGGIVVVGVLLLVVEDSVGQRKGAMVTKEEVQP